MSDLPKDTSDAPHLIKQAAYELGTEVKSIETPDDPLALHKFTITRRDGSDCELHVAGNASFETIHKLIKDNGRSEAASVVLEMDKKPDGKSPV